MEYYQSSAALQIEQKHDALKAARLHHKNIEALKAKAWEKIEEEIRKKASVQETLRLTKSETEVSLEKGP